MRTTALARSLGCVLRRYTTAAQPLHVCVVGTGPAGCYVAQQVPGAACLVVLRMARHPRRHVCLGVPPSAPIASTRAAVQDLWQWSGGHHVGEAPSSRLCPAPACAAAAHVMPGIPHSHPAPAPQDRLPTPFGLVRSGVAPDHQDTKVWPAWRLPDRAWRTRDCCTVRVPTPSSPASPPPPPARRQNVTNQFTRLCQDPRISFMGNVTLGRDVSLAELRAHYNAVCACVHARREWRGPAVGPTACHMCCNAPRLSPPLPPPPVASRWCWPMALRATSGCGYPERCDGGGQGWRALGCLPAGRRDGTGA